MSATSKAVNEVFRNAIRKDIDGLAYDLLLTQRQNKVFEMYYIQKHDINFIADTVGCCSRVVQRELRVIRKKIVSKMNLEID